MPIGLTHLGEAIVQKLIELRPDEFLKLCGRPQTGVHGGRVFREVPLREYAGRRFDGASRVDLVVPLSPTEALPVEVKLGETRLSKTRVDTEWLSGCRTSHGDTAWAGNMMSILDQLIPAHATDQCLVGHVDGADYPLTQAWCVVVRQRTFAAWTGEGRPAFSRARIVSFDELVSAFEPAEFNEIVRELVSFPYYETWINGA